MNNTQPLSQTGQMIALRSVVICLCILYVFWSCRLHIYSESNSVIAWLPWNYLLKASSIEI